VKSLRSSCPHLPLLVLRGKVIPSEVEGTVPEVSRELSGLGSVGGILHDEELEETNKGDELEDAGGRDGAEGAKSVGDGSEGSSVVVNVWNGGEVVSTRVRSRVESRRPIPFLTSTKVGSHPRGDVSSDSKHGNTAVFDLNVTEAI